MIPRLYIPSPLQAGGRVLLPSEMQHYLLRVLRLGAGATVTLFNGQGGEWEGTLTAGAEVTELRQHLPERESPLAVTLVQGLAKAEAMEWAVQKAVEAGVTAIIPLVTQRSVNRSMLRADDHKFIRWQRIAREAAEQSGRTSLPTIHVPVTWETLLPLLPAGPRLLFWEEEKGGRLRQVAEEWPLLKAVTLLVGPEGGFAEEEVQRAKQWSDCRIVGLGPRILRTESAALAALIAVGILWGDLG